MHKLVLSVCFGALGATVLSVGACSDDGADGGGTAGSGNTGNVSNTGGAGNEGGGTGNVGGGQGGSGNVGGGDGGSAPGPKHCAKSCTGAADCCFGNPTCPGDAYPNNPTCEDGLCKQAQCTADADCTVGGLQPDNKCLTIDAGGDDFAVCGTPCMADADCMLLQLECVGQAKDGTKYCSAEVEGCASDDDCSAGGFGDTCDTASGACVCASDAECTAMGVDTCVE